MAEVSQAGEGTDAAVDATVIRSENKASSGTTAGMETAAPLSKRMTAISECLRRKYTKDASQKELDTATTTGAVAWDAAECIGFPTERPKVVEHKDGWVLDTHRRVWKKLFDMILARKKAKARSKDAGVDMNGRVVVVELGSWYGLSVEYFCDRLAEIDAQASNSAAGDTGSASTQVNDSIVYCIDLWLNEHILADDHYNGLDKKDFKPMHKTFLTNLWKHRERCIPLRMPTTLGLRLLHSAGVKPDIIYVDADHHYEPAKADIKLSLELFPDAVICGDDFGHYESVRRAVKECAMEFGKIVTVDDNHCWTYGHVTTNYSKRPYNEGQKKLSFKERMKLRRNANKQKQKQKQKKRKYLDGAGRESKRKK